MQGAALALTLLLLAGGAALAQPQHDIRLDAFRDVCIPTRDDHDATRQAAERGGWRSIAEDDHPALARLMALGTQAIKKDPSLRGSHAAYRREVEGRPLHIVLTLVSAGQRGFVSCHVYEFGTTQGVDPELVNAWLEEQPSETVNEPGIAIMHAWPGRKFLLSTMRTVLVPEGSPVQAQVGFTGAAVMFTVAARDPAKPQ